MGRQLRAHSPLIYALGGGRGHATRCFRLAQALAELRFRPRVLVRAENAGLLQAAAPTSESGVKLVPVEAPASPQELALALKALLAQQPTSWLIVDHFAEGILREFPQGPRLCPWQTLLLRWRNSQSQRPLLQALGAYNQVVELEPGALPEPHADCRSQVLRFHGAAPLLHGSVPKDEIWLWPPSLAHEAFVGRLWQRLRARGLPARRFPFCQPGDTASGFERAYPKVLFGAAGYNLFYECQRLGIAHIALPIPRSQDVQSRRANLLPHPPPQSPDEAEARIEQAYRGPGWLAQDQLPTYPQLAAQLVGDLPEALR